MLRKSFILMQKMLCLRAPSPQQAIGASGAGHSKNTHRKPTPDINLRDITEEFTALGVITGSKLHKGCYPGWCELLRVFSTEIQKLIFAELLTRHTPVG